MPQGRGAGSRLRVRAWQREVTEGLLTSPRPPVGVASISRANGKSTFAGGLGLYAAVADGVPSPFVPLVATTEEQARRLLAVVVRFVKRHEQLAERARVYSDRVVFPAFDDATVIALPAEPRSLLGLDFSFAILDEIGAMHPETWEAVLTAQGKRPDATVLGIGSRVPGGGDLLDDLLAAADREPTWRVWCWSAPDGCDILDESAWAAANPTLDDLVTRDTLRGLARTVPEHSFRAYRLNQKADAIGTWLPAGAWAARTDASRLVPDGSDVVIGFDGSYSGDSTALVGCTVGADAHLFVVGAWENPSDPRWRVPRDEVDASVAAAFDRWTVRRMACDPWGWRREIEAWESAYGDEVVVEYPTNSVARVAPATDRLYQAVQEQGVTHDGDARLATHIGNAHTKATTYGDVIVKDRRGSARKIDLAVAALIAFDQAQTLPPVRRRSRVVAF